MIRNEHDLVIVGGGPAGLSLALHLLHRAPRLRSRLVVLEKERYPREKYCAGAIGRRGELALRRVGVELKVPSVEVGGISVQLPQGRIEATPGSIGRVIRRIEYDHALAQAARRRGVKILEETRALDVTRTEHGVLVRTNQGELRASAVIGADGVGSAVRKAMGLDKGLWRAQVLEVDTPYVADDPPRSLLHFDLSDSELDGYLWDFPTIVDGEELACRGIYRLQIPGRPREEDLQERLARHLERRGLRLSDCKKKRYAERGFVPHEPSSGPRMMLIGEAAGIDPITGEGIAQALLYGEVAAGYLVEQIAQQNFSFVGWPAHLQKTLLGLDLRIRHEICARYFGPARPFYETAFLEIPDAFPLGVDYFAGRKLDRFRQIKAGLQVLQRVWRERAREPLRPWLEETTLPEALTTGPSRSLAQGTPPPMPSSRPSRLVRRLKQGAMALGGVVLLAGGFVGYLHTSSGNNWLRGKVEARLNQRVNGSAQVGELEFSLGSGLTLKKVSLRDPTGFEVVALDEAHAEPSFRQLIRGKADIEEVSVKGVRLHLVQLAEGGTNLTKLFAPKPSVEPPKPTKPSKPLEFLRLAKVSLADGEVDFKKLDGSWITVKGIGVEARVEANPARKDVDAAISKLGASIVVKRPDGQQITVGDLHTGLEAKLQGGAGQIKLLPMGASLGLDLGDGRKVDPTPIALAGLSVGLSQEQITAGLQQLELLMVQVGTVDARVGMAGGNPNGTGEGSLGGVRLDKDKINAFLGKPLLLSHVDLEARLDGSKEKPNLNLGLKTDGGALKATLRLDASGLGKPKFALDLSTDGLQVHKAVQLKDGAEIALSTVAIAAKGEATNKDDAAANITLDLGKTRVRETTIDKAHAEARYEGGVLTVKVLSVEALGQRIDGRGTYTPANKALHAHVEARGDLPALGKALVEAGRKAPPPALLRGIRLGEGVAVEVNGSLDDALDLSIPGARIGLAGGSAAIEGKARLKKGADPSDPSRFVLEEGGASLDVQNIHIPSLLAMLGRPDRGVKGRIDGKIQISGTQTAPSATYDLRTTIERGTERVRARARGKASPGALAMELDADRLAPGTEDRLLHAEIKAPLVVVNKKPRVDPGRPLSVRLDVPSRALKTLEGLLPKPLPPPLADANVSASVALSGTMRAPEATIQIDASGIQVSKLRGNQKVHANITLAPGEGGAVQVTTDLQAWLREDGAPHLTSKVTARLEKSPLVQPPGDVPWTLDATLQPQPLAALLPPEKARPGTVGLHVRATGNRSDVAAQITAALRGLGPGGAPPIDADVNLAIEEEQSKIGLQVRGNNETLAALEGKVGLGGSGLIPRVREKQAPPLDTSFDLLLSVPDRALASLAPWVPALDGAPGKLGGKISLRGPITRVSLDGGLALRELPTAGGTMARTELNLSASPLKLSARLEARPASGEGLTIEARTSPLALAGVARNGGTFPVTVAVSGNGARLSTLIPPTSITRAIEGTVDSDLQAQIEVQTGPQGTRPNKVNFRGELKVHDGTFQVPRSARLLKNVGLQLAGNDGELELKKLEAHESDIEQADRSLQATGKIAFDGVAPREAKLDLQSKKWLVFGGRFGPSDAPRASLDADLGVEVAFLPNARKIHTTVRSLELLSPDRFLRAHQQEEVSTGDVIEVQNASQIGKLPRPKQAEAPRPPPANEGAGTSERVTEIEIELPSTAHVKQAPLDLRISGTVRVRLGAGERSTNGKLTVSGGSIVIGGRIHEVEGGELRFDEEHPGGYVDVTFKRTPNAAALRDVATAGGEVVRVHLTGELGQQKPSYEGLGLGSLFDTLAINNAGRTRFLAQPDMPASQASQLPQFMQLRQMTYMAVNLPHLLFLDRISVWADPYDSRSAYGRLYHHRAERYSASGATRVRTQTRPPGGIGESEGEAAYDLLFQNTPQNVSGVGLKAGTRGGGGPEIFWEWSSKD